MGNCTQSNLERQRQLVELVDSCYNEREKSLNISKYHREWKIILSFRPWEDLKWLNMAYCQITDKQIQDLEKVSVNKIERLWLYNNQLTSKGVEKLLMSEWPELESLHLSRNKVGNQGLKLIMEKKLYKLKSLHLQKNQITQFGILKFIDQKVNSLTQLVLILDQNLIGSNGIKMLIKADLYRLQFLLLSKCGLGNEGAKHLAKAEWPHIKSIDISYNKIGIQGFSSLTEGKWKKLLSLKLKESDDKSTAIGLTWLLNSQTRSPKIQFSIRNREHFNMIDKILNSKICCVVGV